MTKFKSKQFQALTWLFSINFIEIYVHYSDAQCMCIEAHKRITLPEGEILFLGVFISVYMLAFMLVYTHLWLYL